MPDRFRYYEFVAPAVTYISCPHFLRDLPGFINEFVKRFVRVADGGFRLSPHLVVGRWGADRAWFNQVHRAKRERCSSVVWVPTISPLSCRFRGFDRVEWWGDAKHVPRV